MRLMLRVEQAAEFAEVSEDAIREDIKTGALGTRRVEGVAGPHLHARELIEHYGLKSAWILRAFGRDRDADTLEEGAGG